MAWPLDPPDTAAHAPEGGWDMGRSKKLPYEGNDNAEDLATAEVGLALDPAGPWSKELDVTPLGGRTVTVYLKVTGRHAGDNYQIEVTRCGPGGCAAEHLPERVVALSPIVTAWKRIHIERDRMFRRGGVLAKEYFIQQGTCGGAGQPPCCGDAGVLPCDQIRVYEWADVAVDDWIIVFDRSITFASSYAIDYFAPMRQVIQVGDPDADGLRVVTLDSPLSRNFRASPWVLEDPGVSDFRQPVFCDDNGENCHSSGLGVVSGCDAGSNQINAVDSCFFDVDLRGVELAFNDAFVEVYAPREGMSLLPLLGQSWFVWENDYETAHPGENAYPIDYLSWIWFEHRNSDASNYRHVIGAGEAGEFGYRFGLARWIFHWTYVYRGSIEHFGSQQDPPATIAELANRTEGTTNHELGHHFLIPACGRDGHHNDKADPKSAWCSFPWSDPAVCPAWSSSPELCLMNNGKILVQHAQGWDPVMRFCEECLFLGYPECPTPPPGGGRPGAIRTAEDPMP